MALNHVDTSAAMIAGLWADIRRDLGNAPAAAEAGPAPGSALMVAVSGKAIAGPFYLICKRMVPHWRITWEESQIIGDAWGSVIDWIWPDGWRGMLAWLEKWLHRYQPVVDAIKVTSNTLKDRVLEPDKYPLMESQKKQEKPSDSDQVHAPRGAEKTTQKERPVSKVSAIEMLREAT